MSLQARTKRLAVEVLRYIDTIVPGLKGEIVSRQLVRAATSVRSNYRAACRARSRAAFLNKIYTVLEEADETRDWLELVLECQLSTDRHRGTQLVQELDQILAMLFSSQRTAQQGEREPS